MIFETNIELIDLQIALSSVSATGKTRCARVCGGEGGLTQVIATRIENGERIPMTSHCPAGGSFAPKRRERGNCSLLLFCHPQRAGVLHACHRSMGDASVLCCAHGGCDCVCEQHRLYWRWCRYTRQVDERGGRFCFLASRGITKPTGQTDRSTRQYRSGMCTVLFFKHLFLKYGRTNS